MANRATFPNGVEVGSRVLTSESNFRSEDLHDVTLDSAVCGVKSGLTVTVNGTYATKVNISLGYGYVQNGERVELTSDSLANQLADYTLGTINYVCLMYDESFERPETHEISGTMPTIAKVSPRVVILTESQYNALAVTDPVLSRNSQDRSLILAKVTANGPSVALTANSIVSPTGFQNQLQVSQPVLITGVDIVNIDSTTSTGTGELKYNGSTKELSWKSPGGSDGSTSTITSTGQYTLTSGGTLKTLTVYANYGLLPLSGATITDTITVSNLYAQEVDRFTPTDLHHRSMMGTGIPTTRNPHGLTLQDIDTTATSSLTLHQDIQHSNGIAPGSSPDLLKATFNTGSPDYIELTEFSPGDSIYINGKVVASTLSSTDITFDDATHNSSSLYGIYINQDGTIFKSLRALYPDPDALSTKLQIVNCSDALSGTHTIYWSTGGSIRLDNGPSIGKPTISALVRLYDNNMEWIDVYFNAPTTNPGTNQSYGITFSALPNKEENFRIAYAYLTESTTKYVGYGFGTANANNKLVDSRVFGNMSFDNMTSDYAPVSHGTIRDTICDGVIPKDTNLSFATECGLGGSMLLQLYASSVIAPGTTTVNGGTVLINGKEVNVSRTALSGLTSSVVNRIYVNHHGVVKSSTSTWDEILRDEYQNASDNTIHRSLIQLFEVTLDGSGDETDRVDLRNWLNFRKNKPFGVFGIDYDGTAKLVTGNTRTIYARSTYNFGVGIDGEGGNFGVHGKLINNGTTPSGSAGVYGDGSTLGHGVAGVTQNATSYAIYGDGGTTSTAIAGVNNSNTKATISGINSGGGDGVYGSCGAGTGRVGVKGEYNGLAGNGSFGGYFRAINPTGNYALGVGGGHAKFAGDNPAPSDGFTNVQTPKNICKAWALITTNGSGTVTLVDGFNVYSLSISGTSNEYLNIYMKNPLYWDGAKFQGVAFTNFGMSDGYSYQSNAELAYVAGDVKVIIRGIIDGGTLPINWSTLATTVYLVIFGTQSV